MIFFLASLLSIISLVLLFIKPYIGILMRIMSKPGIDASWESTLFMNINWLKVVGVSVPILILIKILLSSKKNFFQYHLALIGIVYLFSSLFGIFGVLSFGNLYQALDFFARILNGFLAFFMLQAYFYEKDRFKALLLCMMIAGIFPIFMSLYQTATGVDWRGRETIDMVRNVGIYHDAFNIRFYGFQTITAVLLFWSYFSNRNFLTKLALFTVGFLACFSIFKVYSKAAIVIFIVWVVIWSLFNKKMLWLVSIPLILIVVNVATNFKMIKDIQTLYTKEIKAYGGKIDPKKTLSGRWVIWEQMFDNWKDKSMFYKFFGSGTSAGSAHNDFLRFLFSSGIQGLLVYLTILIIVGYRLIVNYIRGPSPLNVMAIMLFVMLCVDSLGLVPTFYPAYLWFVWGFISLSLRGIEGLDGQGSEVQVNSSVHVTRPTYSQYTIS